MSFAFLAIALVPQSATAQTQPTDKKVKKEVVSKVPGDVVPRDGQAKKAIKMKEMKKGTKQEVATKEGKKMKATPAKKKEPVKLIVRPLKGKDDKAKIQKKEIPKQ